MKKNKLFNELMQSPRIINSGLTEEFILEILSTYNEILMENLLKSGNIDVGNGMHIDIVRLFDRSYVLRGVSYKGSRKYKLKLNMDEEIYKRIESYYTKLQEEML